MNMKKFITVLTLSMAITLLICARCMADIVYFKNGKQLEAVTETTSAGVLVDGLFFKNEEIIRVEKKALKRRNNSGEPWYQGVLNLVGIKSKKQKRTEQVLERLKRNKTVLKEMNLLYDKEREAAKRDSLEDFKRAIGKIDDSSESITSEEEVSKSGNTYIERAPSKKSTYKVTAPAKGSGH